MRLFKFTLHIYELNYTITFNPVTATNNIIPYNIKKSKIFYINLNKEDVISIGVGSIFFEKIKLKKLEVIFSENISRNILRNLNLEDDEVVIFILDNSEIEKFEKFMEVEPGTFSSELLREELEK